MREMRSLVLKRLMRGSFSRSSSRHSIPFLLSSRRGNLGFSDGLNWALARRGVVVKDKAFQNLTYSELQQKGATIAASVSELPLFVRGHVNGGTSDISKAQYSKLLKQVTAHLSSISNVFVQDGAIGSSSECDAKVRVISDNASALLKFSSILWKTPNRAVSHDSCPLTVYVATSISQGVMDAVGFGARGGNGFIAADIQCSSLILCGQAFSDTNGIKEALAALSVPIISARGGLLLSGRLLVLGDSVILLLAPEDTIQSCADLLVSADTGVILSSQGITPLYQTGNSGGPDTFKLPAAVVLASSDRLQIWEDCTQALKALDLPFISYVFLGLLIIFLQNLETYIWHYTHFSLLCYFLLLLQIDLCVRDMQFPYSWSSSGIIPCVAKLSPGQAAYHFLAGYQNGKFVPAYNKFPSIYFLELAKALLSKLKDHKIPSFLVNVKNGETNVTGNDFWDLVRSTLSKDIPPFEPKGGNLQEKYKRFLFSKFQEIPEEFSF